MELTGVEKVIKIHPHNIFYVIIKLIILKANLKLTITKLISVPKPLEDHLRVEIRHDIAVTFINSLLVINSIPLRAEIRNGLKNKPNLRIFRSLK